MIVSGTRRPRAVPDSLDRMTRVHEEKVMMPTKRSFYSGLAAMSLVSLASVYASGQQPAVKIPESGVPQVMTLEGKFVRVAYNNEGYVILGYQIANRTVGEDWVMLDVGITLMEKVPTYELTRDALSLDTPDGKLALPSIEEYRENESKVQPLQNRMKVQRDSINYFPPWTTGVNRLGFFADLGSRAMPWNQADVTNSRACVGQLYFHVPGGTKHGQYLAEREVRAERRARALPAPDQGRGRDARQELRRHQEAGQGRVPKAEIAGGRQNARTVCTIGTQPVMPAVYGVKAPL